MFYIGDIIELKIEKMVYEGYGLARKDGFVFFVENVCDGDLIEAEITKVKKNFANAKLIKIIEPSPYRVEPFCPIFNACGGCQWQFIDYNHQLDIKQDIVKEILSKTFEYNTEVQKTMASPEIKEFRHKIQMPVSQTKNSKRFLIGYYKKSSHDIVNNKFCPIQPPVINDILERIREKAQELNLTAYNEKNYKGDLRHIIFRISKNSGKILVCFVINNTKIPQHIKSLAEFIFKEDEKISGVSINFNTAKGNVILGQVTENIIGEKIYTEKIGDINYVISPESFFQINPGSFKNILDKVKVLIRENSEGEKPSILDAYSGVGSFGLYIADIANKVTCVEEVKSACENTKEACRINNIKNIDVINEDAQKAFESLINENKKFDFIILDPPRKGCSSEALDYCAKLTDRYIVYVSCNPNSLARDVKYLEKYGFKLKYVHPADMFCHTYHVETVTLIEKNNLLR